MSTQTPTPDYIPAPYLTSGGFLTASQLVFYFQDFHASFQRTQNAPEFLFERLVGNLNCAFTTIIEQERRKQEIALTNCTEEKEELQDLNDQLSKELAELKSTSEHRQTTHLEPSDQLGSKLEQRFPNSPITGIFLKKGITRDSDSDSAPFTNRLSEVVFFGRNLVPPVVSTGLTFFHVGIPPTSISVTASEIGDDRFTIYHEATNCSTLSPDVGCAWLAVKPHDKHFQCGIFTVGDHQPPETYITNRHWITFSRPYPKPPQVVVWLNHFEFGTPSGRLGRRLQTYATNITCRGFILNINHGFGYSLPKNATVSWVSCTAGKTEVFSGSFNTPNNADGSHLGQRNSGYVGFDSGTFTAAPQAMMGINQFKMGCDNDMRLDLKITDITATGMKWHLDTWSDTVLYSAGASFLAFVDI